MSGIRLQERHSLTTPGRRRYSAADREAVAALHGAKYLAAVDPKQRPLVAYVPKARVPRIHR